MKKILKYTFSIFVTIGLSYSLLYAWSGLTASDGDTLDYTKWNQLVDKVSSISISEGKVGIGVSEPDRPLHIISSDPTNIVKIQSTSPNGWSSIDYIDDAGSFSMSMGVANSAQTIAGQAYIHAQGSHPLVLGQRGEAMRIAPGKNIGMGVIDPQVKLDVAGGVKVSDSQCDNDRIGTIQYNTTTNFFQGCRDNGGVAEWVNLH